MSSGDVVIESLGDATVQKWDEYVRHNERTTLYHLAIWRDIVKKIFGHSGLYLYARSGSGAVTGILPLIQLRSRIFGNFLVSMPYVNYGGAVGDTPEIEQALMSHAGNYAKNNNLTHCEFRDESPRDKSWPVRSDKVVMELMLPDDQDALWGQLKSKLRAQVKRPMKAGAHAVFGSKDLLDEFYGVFSRNMRDLGTPVYSKYFFAEILRVFPDNSHIVVIRKDDKPVAAAFLLGYRERLEIPWASSIKEYNPLGVNMLLYWEVLAAAIRNGYSLFDFGRSTIDGGTYRFKMQWGAEPRQLYWHYWLNEGRDVPKMNPDNPKYKYAINVWKQLPLWLTNSIGPKIVKNLP